MIATARRCFVLSTGRCGSTTVARAFGHATNWTAGHETRAARIDARLDYPERHIEVDNRLSWFLGTLDRMYGTDPVYVHLQRDPEEVAFSYSHRFRGNRSIVKATANGILQRKDPPTTDAEWLAVSRLAVQTVEDNIGLFLRDKPWRFTIHLDDLRDGFDRVWRTLGCEGDLAAAHAELDVRHNATPRKRRR